MADSDTTRPARTDTLADRGSSGGAPAPLAHEVVAIFGPTASGKSEVAEALADRLGTEVVSTDAMQVYRGLPILTNQPERPTRLVAIRELDEEMSVGAFATAARAEIAALVASHGIAVVAGGTGLYLRAALADLDVPPRAEPERRMRIEREVDNDRTAAHDRLRGLDPSAADAIHANDRRRLVRALELAEIGDSLVRGKDRLWGTATLRPTLIVGLDVPPDVLSERIRVRTREMFERGVVDEVRAALARPLSRTAEKTMGLRDVAELPPEAARDRLAIRTARYATYQRKWMARIPGIVLVDANRPPAEIVDDVLQLVRR
jgi:tRNA dimethylallyltransferase